MKQYLTQEQTAKLIELGGARARIAAPGLKWEDGVPTIYPQYTIGELIEMLPKAIEHEIWFGEDKGQIGVWGLRIDTGGTDYGWDITYTRDSSAYLYRVGRTELIDALYDMIVKLKEEGVI